MKKKRDAPRLQTLEGSANGIANAIGRVIPEGVGFTLMLFDFGENGFLTYQSNAKRSDMAKTMIEMLEKLRDDPRSDAETVRTIKKRLLRTED